MQKDEIKEILEGIEVVIKHDGTLEFNAKELKILLDYITNLQEENEEYKKLFNSRYKRPYAKKYLEEQKRKMKNNSIIGLDSETIYKDYYMLKSRIDKGIKYIKNHTIEWVDERFEVHNVMVDVDEYFNPEHAIWLLNGGDEE